MRRTVVRLVLFEGESALKHAALTRQVPGADTAVLFIHGISGTPRHFERLIDLVSLVPEEWSVCNLCLPGHGGTVRDFSASSMEQWKTGSERAFRQLCKMHDRVVIVAHSMGSLFAANLAAENPRKTGGLFLLAVPLRPKFQLSNAARLLRLAFGRMRKNDARDRALSMACGVEPTWKLWKYFGWIPRFLELFSEMRRSENVFLNLKHPTVVIQSGRDELVSKRTEQLLRKNTRLRIICLPESGHFYYAPQERECIMKAFSNFVEDMKKHD